MITQYTESRYKPAAESCWRIIHYNASSISECVSILAVHLEDEQNIYYEEDNDIGDGMKKSRKTTLENRIYSGQVKKESIAKKRNFNQKLNPCRASAPNVDIFLFFFRFSPNKR